MYSATTQDPLHAEPKLRQNVTARASGTGREGIPLSVLTAYGSGGIIPIALFNVAGILVGLMGNISLGLSAFWLGVILVVPRISDAIADPLIGHLSDNARTRWGRRRPFVLLGGLLSALFFVLMWWIPKGETIRALFPSESGYQWFQLGYILVSLTLFFTSVTLFEIPHGALGMEMTTDPHQRTRLFSAKSFVGNLFAMSTPWLLVLANLELFKGPRGNEVDGMRYVSLLVAAVIVPLTCWWFFVLEEPGFSRAAQQEASPFWPNMRRALRNVNFVVLTLTIFTLSMGFNFVQLLGSYIPIYYVSGGDKTAGAMLLGINGSVWAVTGLLAVFPLNWLSPRLGKRSTLALAIALIVLAQLAKIVCYDPRRPYLMAIPTVPLSCGMLFFFTLGSSMVGDICDEDELHTGARSEGAFYAVFWWFIKTGTALANLISGALIVLTLFDEGQVTKVDQLTGNVRDIRAMVAEREANEPGSAAEPHGAEAARALVDTAQAEAAEFVTYLEGAALTIAEQGDEARARRDVVVPALFAMKAVAAELAHARRRVGSLRPQSPPRLIDEMLRDIAALRMRAKLEMTRVRADELHAYFLTRARDDAESRAHYLALAHDEQTLGALLARTSDALPPAEFAADLERVVGALSPMSRQAPFTLLTMRLIEIGLPLLACFASLLFVFRYRLTEERSREIKGVLAERRAAAEPPVLPRRSTAMIVHNDRGLSFSFSAAGGIAAIDAGPIAVSPRAGSWLARSVANLFLRRRAQPIAATPLLGPASPSRYRSAPGVLEAQGSAAELQYTCTLSLDPADSVWRFAVHVENRGTEPLELDLLYVQHVSLKTASAGLSNEAYVAQYLERRVLQHPEHGAVVLCRQNMREATGHPWLMLASAGHAASASTDGQQFYGPSFRATGEPEALRAAALGGELAGEAAVVALQEAPFVLAPGAAHRCVFVVAFLADHPEASSEADLDRLPALVAEPPALAKATHIPLAAPELHRFHTPRFLPALDLDSAAIARAYGNSLRHVERDGQTLLSFFCDGPRHVVLREKEQRVLRPHGHILQACAGAVPDERVMSTTTFACGVFNAHLTQGNTNFNTLLSVCTTPATPSLEGQRIFVQLEEGEYLLGVPSAFEMGLGHCRWLYEHPRVCIEVCTWTSPSEPHVHLALRVLRGGPLRFSITHQFDGLGWDVAPLVGGQLVATPRAGSMLASSFPDARFRLVLHDAPPGLHAQLLPPPEGAGTEPCTLVLEVPPSHTFTMSFVGEVAGPAATPHISDPAQAQRDAARAPLTLDLHGATAAEPLAETLPWYALNAFVHYLTPYGLEQFSGAAWGTRDVCQGPIELLLAQGQHAAAKEVLRILFSRQDPDGGWPQWWMFDRYASVRADGAHGDVVYWCVLALCSYLRASSDFAFLDEPLPFFAPAGEAAERAPLGEHVERVLALMERSFVPGTALVQFGGGDWNDSLQPVSEELARRMVSSWTVQMSYQAVDEYRALCEHTGRSARARELGALAARIHADFQQHLVADGVVAGYGLVGDDGRIALLLHPRDTRTGVRYSLLPMDRGVISCVFTPAQAAAHLALIGEQLTGPDGARLMDRPLRYTGGQERLFRRAESSCYFGREIGLMYVHEHLRYAETLARLGKPEAFLRALRQATPVAYREVVPEGTLRQANCYYSSSDVLFPSRYDADVRYADVLAGKLPLEGGWRVYSSGPGIFIAHVVTRLLGVRSQFGQLIVDPVLAPSLDGLCATLPVCGRAVRFVYRVRGAGFGPSALAVNGHPLPFTREPHPYRTGGAMFPRAAFEALLGPGENVVEVVV